MGALLRFYDTDNVTVISSVSLGNINTPGTSIEKKLYVENYGDVALDGGTVAIVQVGLNDGDDYALVAPDVAGVPGSFTAGPLAIGTLAIATKYAFWTKAVLPSGLTPDLNQRVYLLRGQGTTL